jgi:hypothetical protein
MQNVTDLISLAKPGMDDIHILIRSSERVRSVHKQLTWCDR